MLPVASMVVASTDLTENVDADVSVNVNCGDNGKIDVREKNLIKCLFLFANVFLPDESASDL